MHPPYALWRVCGALFVSPYYGCCVQSLINSLARVRWQTFYAQERARLDRTQRVLDIPDSNRGWIFALASHLLYGIPSARATELEKLYVDNLVYVHAWADFVRKSQNEWKEHLPWVCPYLHIRSFFMSSCYSS